MADTTIQGYAGGAAVTIPSIGAVNADLFDSIANLISAAVRDGTFVQATGTTIPVASGTNNVVAVDVSGAVSVGAAYGALLYTNSAGSLTIQAAAGLDVLSGTGGIIYYGAADTTGASGVASIAAGGGNNLVAFDAGAQYAVSLGDGADTVYANGSGLTDVAGGSNLVMVNAGSNTVFASGRDDTIIAGAGSATIGSSGENARIFIGAGGAVVAAGGTNATVVAGSGAATIFAGANSTTYFNSSSAPLLFAGIDVATTVVGGSTAATIFGASGSDVTYFNAPGAAGALLVAGAGSETLDASGSNVGNTMFSGSGRSTLLGGSGADLIVGSAGSGTLTGGAGADQFIFSKDAAAGSFLITDFLKGTDSLILSRYDPTEVSSAVTGATVANGATSITLSDGTRITFANVTAIDSSIFKTS